MLVLTLECSIGGTCISNIAKVDLSQKGADEIASTEGLGILFRGANIHLPGLIVYMSGELVLQTYIWKVPSGSIN